jgi:hydroxyacylglutathione hydrolase
VSSRPGIYLSTTSVTIANARLTGCSALGTPPTQEELREFNEILDPDGEGHTNLPSFLAIAALKLHSKHDNENEDEVNEEIDHAFSLFTNGVQGPITIGMLKRVARELREDIGEDALRDMILEANGGRGVGNGVERDEFESVMRRAGVFK